MLIVVIGVIIAIFGIYCMFSSSDVNPIMQPVGLGFVGFGGFLAAVADPDGVKVGGIILALAMIAVAVFWTKHVYEKNDPNRPKSEAEQRTIKEEYSEAVRSQQASEPWTIRYSTSPCPYCGHYKVRYAKWEDKRAHVLFWGATSEKLGTNYKCENCERMW